ncbi:MAG TPA: hypothetical protein VMS65_16980 [Polyangiaceae bacterium]|nr:hypothetical protein [Polyangiaceae bacterium]
MTTKNLSSVLVLLFALTALTGCGEPEETCTCTCACDSGEKPTIDDAEDEEDCSSTCEVSCGGSYTANFDCTTKG